MSGLRRAVAFLTAFGGAARPGPDAVAWFPVVGVAVGLGLGGVWWLCERAWTPSVAAAVVVIADLGGTGMLHFDGLVDSADGLLSHLPRDRRLTVMSRPGVGAFGIGAGGAALLARWASIAAISPAPLLLAGLWCASRTAMAVIARSQAYARPVGGLATAFLGPGRALPLVLGGMASIALVASWRLVAGPAAVAAGGLAALAVMALARRQLGGFTGDVLGAAGFLLETVGLVVAAAKW